MLRIAYDRMTPIITQLAYGVRPHCKKQCSMLQSTAPLLPGTRPVLGEGSMAKRSGSAAPQNTTPAPMPVHSEMPNHWR